MYVHLTNAENFCHSTTGDDFKTGSNLQPDEKEVDSFTLINI